MHTFTGGLKNPEDDHDDLTLEMLPVRTQKLAINRVLGLLPSLIFVDFICFVSILPSSYVDKISLITKLLSLLV